MKKILLISDNHGYWDKAILHHAEWADEIWHAGDWLNTALFIELEKTGKPVRGVWGNADGQDLRVIFPENNVFTVEGIKVLITHIGGYPGRYTARARNEIKQHRPELFICGHSHILRVDRDPAFNKMLCLNPGACGKQGFHKIRTALRFICDLGKIAQLEAIEFGNRNI